MERGDVFHVRLDPVAGREQAGARYVLIVTTSEFNRLGTPVVVPITLGGNFARTAGFAVSLTGLGTNVQGVVLCNQPRVLDVQSRGGRFIERLPNEVVDDVLARLATLLD